MTQNHSAALEDAIRRICHRPSQRVPGSSLMRQAAVAINMRQTTPTGPIELLMIQRAKLEGDPWSGQMAFPGGRIEEQDDDPLAAAIRECQEEIDLDLQQHATHRGKLSERPAVARVKIKPLVIFPYIFELHETPALTFSQEVDQVVWIPLDFFRDQTNRTTMTYKKLGMSWDLPCYHFGTHTVWGLSLQMIDEMCERLND